MSHPTPRAVVDRQLAAYNAHDIAAYAALFAEDAVVGEYVSGEVRLRGRSAIAAFYARRFADNPELRCTVTARIDLGTCAIDRETVTGLPGPDLELVAIYEVRDGLIQSLRFIRAA